ncbi:MAG: VWA domain-containing protein [bacterium]|nr:VWA domain-containing protein [bacterium]
MKHLRLRIPILITAILFSFLVASPAFAGTELLILLDASGNMAGPGAPGTGHTKFVELKSALNTMLQNLPADVAVGLRVMGGSPSADCFSSYLYYPPSQGFRSTIQDYLDSVSPSGTRALAQGVEDGLSDLTTETSGMDRILLVLTGGSDDCGRTYDTLISNMSYEQNPPKIVIFATDLSNDESQALGELASQSGGRLTALESTADFAATLFAYSQGFSNNLRVYLVDGIGNAVDGDIVVTNTSNSEIVAEMLDIADYSITVPPGTYEVTGRYLGQEMSSDVFTMQPGDSKTISLEFDVYQESFTLTLRDLDGLPFPARAVFLNSLNEPVLTTEVNSVHRVQLPPDTYTIEITYSDMVETIYGVRVGPESEPNLEYEMPVEMANLQVEVSNLMGTPLNAEVTIFDNQGSVINEAPFTSYLYATVPPGEYRVTAEFEGNQDEETVYIYPGDTLPVALEIDVQLGDIFVMLRTEAGNDIWGWVRLYDSDGNLLERYDTERIESPDWYFRDIPVGIYRIDAEAEDTIRTYDGVEVTADQETEITITFPDEVY